MQCNSSSRWVEDSAHRLSCNLNRQAVAQERFKSKVGVCLSQGFVITLFDTSGGRGVCSATVSMTINVCLKNHLVLRVRVEGGGCACMRVCWWAAGTQHPPLNWINLQPMELTPLSSPSFFPQCCSRFLAVSFFHNLRNNRGECSQFVASISKVIHIMYKMWI